MWQQVIVYVIGGLLAGYVVWRIVRLFVHRGRPYDPCAGCSGCDLRTDFRKKQLGCSEKGIQGKPIAQKNQSKKSTGCGCAPQ